MTEHIWQTYQSTVSKQHDECLRCPARRIRGVNTKWDWRYTILGSEICAGAHDSSPKEGAFMTEGRK